MALLRGRESVMQRFRPMLRAHEVTEQQWRVLRAIQAEGAVSASELSRKTLISMPSLSRIIRSLNDRGLIQRHSRQDDLRGIELSLSELAEQLMQRVGPESERIYQEVASQFGMEDLNQLYLLLDRLTEVLEDNRSNNGK